VGVGTVAIAWKDTPEAAHAVAAAMPFVRRATRVVILSVEEDAKSTEPSCERLRHAIRWQNPRVIVHHLQQDGRHPVETMLEGVATLGADLLVMGGYSHSRMREVVFGGFTRRVLKSAELPVLMAH
jgi:nucleotide-binding universal stress UspA family protein